MIEFEELYLQPEYFETDHDLEVYTCGLMSSIHNQVCLSSNPDLEVPRFKLNIPLHTRESVNQGSYYNDAPVYCCYGHICSLKKPKLTLGCNIILDKDHVYYSSENKLFVVVKAYVPKGTMIAKCSESIFSEAIVPVKTSKTMGDYEKFLSEVLEDLNDTYL